MMVVGLSFIIYHLSFSPVWAQNPYLPLWEHLPDGEPRVFEDPDQPGKFRAYIIGSHDVTYTAYCGPDIRMWSAPVEDLTQWRDEGPIFSWFVNGQWDTMFAPDLVETVDKTTGKKTYWLYPHSRGWRRVAMVCKGDRPNGPFTPVNLTADGTQVCLAHSSISIPRYSSRTSPIKRIRTSIKASVPMCSMASSTLRLASLTRTPCTQSVRVPNSSIPSSQPAVVMVNC